MKTAKIFQNGRSQAVRLPKDFRFDGDEVFVHKVGNAVVLLPVRREPDLERSICQQKVSTGFYCYGWDTFFQSLEQFSVDYMQDARHQPPMQKRDFSCFD